jgi:hypothetical protein
MRRGQPGCSRGILHLQPNRARAAAQRKRIFAHNLARTGDLNWIAPVANGRKLPKASATANTTRVASRPSAMSSESSGFTAKTSSVPLPDSVLVAASLSWM